MPVGRMSPEMSGQELDVENGAQAVTIAALSGTGRVGERDRAEVDGDARRKVAIWIGPWMEGAPGRPSRTAISMAAAAVRPARTGSPPPPAERGSGPRYQAFQKAHRQPSICGDRARPNGPGAVRHANRNMWVQCDSVLVATALPGRSMRDMLATPRRPPERTAEDAPHPLALLFAAALALPAAAEEITFRAATMTAICSSIRASRRRPGSGQRHRRQGRRDRRAAGG